MKEGNFGMNRKKLLITTAFAGAIILLLLCVCLLFAYAAKPIPLKEKRAVPVPQYGDRITIYEQIPKIPVVTPV